MFETLELAGVHNTRRRSHLGVTGGLVLIVRWSAISLRRLTLRGAAYSTHAQQRHSRQDIMSGRL